MMPFLFANSWLHYLNSLNTTRWKTWYQYCRETLKRKKKTIKIQIHEASTALIWVTSMGEKIHRIESLRIERKRVWFQMLWYSTVNAAHTKIWMFKYSTACSIYHFSKNVSMFDSYQKRKKYIWHGACLNLSFNDPGYLVILFENKRENQNSCKKINPNQNNRTANKNRNKE